MRLELDLATIEEIYRAWRVGAYGDMSLSQAISSRIEDVLVVKENLITEGKEEEE